MGPVWRAANECDESRRRWSRSASAIARGALAGTLSGGERQLTAVARALVVRPALLVADEPTGSVDSVNAERVMDLIVDYGRESDATVVVVTHDRTVARRLDRVLRMRDGRTLD